MKEITTIVCKLEQDANVPYHNVTVGECSVGQGLIYDHMTGYRCLRANGTLGHCIRVTSDGSIFTNFNVRDGFKVSLVINDLNQLKTTTLKNAGKKKAFIWDGTVG